MRPLVAIPLGGLTAGALYITFVLASFAPRGVSETRILQYIASGLLGEAAFEGGWRAATLGLGLHFAIAIVMAAAFVLIARAQPILLERAWVSGILYGALIFVIMSYVVVPSSAARDWNPWEGWGLAGNLMAHCSYVGLPIALIAQRVQRRRRRDRPSSAAAYA